MAPKNRNIKGLRYGSRSVASIDQRFSELSADVQKFRAGFATSKNPSSAGVSDHEKHTIPFIVKRPSSRNTSKNILTVWKLVLAVKRGLTFKITETIVRVPIPSAQKLLKLETSLHCLLMSPAIRIQTDVMVLHPTSKQWKRNRTDTLLLWTPRILRGRKN